MGQPQNNPMGQPPHRGLPPPRQRRRRRSKGKEEEEEQRGRRRSKGGGEELRGGLVLDGFRTLSTF
jgi:hypothetical protein